MTTAFGALAVRVMSRLILLTNGEKSGEATGGAEKIHGPLVVLNPVDGRKMKLISSNKRDNEKKNQGFPVVGNYTFPHLTQVSFDDALSCPLEEIARRCKEGLNRLPTDEEYRLHQVAAAMSHASGHMGYLCGSTCFRIPALLQKVSVDVRSDMLENDYDPIPRCFFMVLGHGSNAAILAGMKLPLPALTEQMVRATIYEAAMGTVFANILCKSQIKDKND